MPPMLPLSRAPAGENCSRLLFGSLSVIGRIARLEETAERAAKDPKLSAGSSAGDAPFLHPGANRVGMDLRKLGRFLHRKVLIAGIAGGAQSSDQGGQLFPENALHFLAHQS